MLEIRSLKWMVRKISSVNQSFMWTQEWGANSQYRTKWERKASKSMINYGHCVPQAFRTEKTFWINKKHFDLLCQCQVLALCAHMLFCFHLPRQDFKQAHQTCSLYKRNYKAVNPEIQLLLMHKICIKGIHLQLPL